MGKFDLIKVNNRDYFLFFIFYLVVALSVFWGTISFPLYILHSVKMRSVLVCVVHGLTPQSEEEWRRISRRDEGPLESAGCTFPVGFSFWVLAATSNHCVRFMARPGLVY